MQNQIAQPRYLLAVRTLCRREVVRFLRQRHRVFSALGQPIFFWLLFGFGFQGSLRPFEGSPIGSIEFFFPGTVVLILLFTAIFSTISVIEDRREGFLQGVLVSPVPRSAMVLGKILGGTLLALFQGILFLLLAPVAGLSLTPLSFLEVAGFLFLIAFALTGLGFAIAWRMDSTQGFHAIMMVFLMPLWLLSGAFFPAESGPAWLSAVVKINPLTYGVAAVRGLLHPPGELVQWGVTLPSLWLCLAVTAGFGVTMWWLSTRTANRKKVY